MSESEQLLLDLAGAPSLTRDDLIVSPANLDAASLIDRWPGWVAPYAVLVGPQGCGKTHLAEIWRKNADAHVINPEELLDADLDAAQQGKPLLIDGLTPENLDETQLFHLMNAVRNAQSHMLLTTETPMEHWSIATPDLVSRVKSATTVQVAPPDDALLTGVITKLFSDRQIEVQSAVIDYIVQRIERSLGVANQLVDQLDKLALANKSSVTKPLVKRLLDSMSDGQSVHELL